MKKNAIFLTNSLIAITSLSFAIYYNFYWPLVLTGISLAFIMYHKELYKWALYLLLPSLVFVCLYTSFVPHYVTLSSLFSKVDRAIPIRNDMMSYINDNYNSESRDFIYMLMFNQKENHFYKDLINLNVAHLFVISGLHISIFCAAIKKLIKNEYACLVVNILFTVFIFYLTKFSISILRVLMTLIITQILKRFELDSFQRTCITGWAMFLLFPLSCTSMGFVLTMLCTLFITYVVNQTSNHWLQFILINLFTSIVILPITISFNSKVNVLYFLNNLLFSNAIIIIYYFELLTCWIPFMFSFNSDMIHVIRQYLSALSDLQSFVYIKITKPMIVACYAFMFCGWNCYEYKQNVYNTNNILYNKMYANNY